MYKRAWAGDTCRQAQFWARNNIPDLGDARLTSEPKWMSSDDSLERLEEAAEAVVAQHPTWSDSESEYSPSESSSEVEEAATTERKPRRRVGARTPEGTPAVRSEVVHRGSSDTPNHTTNGIPNSATGATLTRNAGPTTTTPTPTTSRVPGRTPDGTGNSLYITENDDVLNAASWQDLEDERRFLEKSHQSNLEDLLYKLENEIDDGDDIDLQTGRIVSDVGHLRALPAQQGFLGEESESEDEIEEVEAPEESVIYAVCQRPLVYLDKIMTIE